MADEQAPEQSGSPVVRGLIFGGIVVLTAAIAGLLVFRFLLQPMLAPAEAGAPEGLPPGMITYDFPEMNVSVIPDDPEFPTPILIFQVAVACKNPLTAELIAANRSWFMSMLNDVHQYKTKSELNDPQVKESMRRQAMQKANALLGELAPGQDVEVIRVLHTKYFVYDP